MPDETQVPDPITALAEGAAQMHEMYAAYMDAGFPEPRAFELVREMMAMTVFGNDG